MVEYKIAIPPVNLWNFSRLKFWKKDIMTLDELVGRMLQLEQEYLDLKLAYEELQREYDAYRTGHRDESETRYDSLGCH